MNRVCIIVAILCGFAAVEATADDPETRADIERLVKQLQASSRQERQAAEKQLLEFGPRILPILPPADLQRSASARAGLRRIRLQLEKAKAVASIQASQFQLSGKHSLKQIFNALIAETSNELDYSKLSEEKLSDSYDVGDKPVAFWPFIDRLAKAFQLSMKPNDGGGIQFDHGESVLNEVQYSGAFRIQATQAKYRKIFGNDQEKMLSIRLALLSEPRLRPLFLTYSPGDFQAEINGRPLQVRSRTAKLELPLGEGGAESRLKLDFSTAASQSQKQVQLSGQLSMLVAAGTERIEFTRIDKSAGVSRRRGGVTAILQQAKQTADTINVRIAISYERGGPAFESHRTWVFHNSAYLDVGGQKVQYEDFRNPLQAGKSVIVEYIFPRNDLAISECRFVYEAPTLLINVPIKVDFKKLAIDDSTP